MSKYSAAKDPDLIGTYPAFVGSGGYVWDEVLEYRVWCHPHDGAPDFDDGDDYFYSFETYEEALAYSLAHAGTEAPLVLVLQEEYIDEPEPEKYIHIKEKRIAEWKPEFLSRPQRNEHTIPDFFSPHALSNRLDIIRGLA
ncbi:GCN5 family acetyltransferase [Hymenobacter sp. UV11]|uniref:GCN5 family acetyltransferase n=1 Tax=Hymenobacter sp. UV11 TaxID=1849735 RepID=UPI00105FCF82|nr:GCN5 family acetyltransferase [Hymenobacter sp. UV11]TFZ67595.1 GCN5 family acetyltransferase [Hymenobacter sp. UV11]